MGFPHKAQAWVTTVEGKEVNMSVNGFNNSYSEASSEEDREWTRNGNAGGGGGGGWESPRVEPHNGIVQPRVIAPVGKPTRHTNQLEYMQKEVLKAVVKHKHSWPFTKPVDTIKLGLTDYHNIVKRPMDIGTIEKRLKHVYYYSAKECMEVRTSILTHYVQSLIWA